MAKIIKFYLSDGSNVELSNAESEFELFVGIKNTVKYADIFYGYNEYPESNLILKTFYENNLVNKTITKIEFYSDSFLLDTIKQDNTKNIETRWQSGRLRNGENVIQEEINISEYYIK